MLVVYLSPVVRDEAEDSLRALVAFLHLDVQEAKQTIKATPPMYRKLNQPTIKATPRQT